MQNLKCGCTQSGCVIMGRRPMNVQASPCLTKRLGLGTFSARWGFMCTLTLLASWNTTEPRTMSSMMIWTSPGVNSSQLRPPPHFPPQATEWGGRKQFSTRNPQIHTLHRDRNLFIFNSKLWAAKLYISIIIIIISADISLCLRPPSGLVLGHYWFHTKITDYGKLVIMCKQNKVWTRVLFLSECIKKGCKLCSLM